MNKMQMGTIPYHRIMKNLMLGLTSDLKSNTDIGKSITRLKNFGNNPFFDKYDKELRNDLIYTLHANTLNQIMEKSQYTLNEAIVEHFGTYTSRTPKKQLTFSVNPNGHTLVIEELENSVVLSILNNFLLLLNNLKTGIDNDKFENIMYDPTFIAVIGYTINNLWKLIASVSTNAGEGATQLVSIINNIFVPKESCIEHLQNGEKKAKEYAVIKCDKSDYTCGRYIFTNGEQDKCNKMIIYKTVSENDDDADAYNYMSVLEMLDGGNNNDTYYNKYIKYKQKYLTMKREYLTMKRESLRNKNI